MHGCDEPEVDNKEGIAFIFLYLPQQRVLIYGSLD